MVWPSQPSDCIPIENVWTILKELEAAYQLSSTKLDIVFDRGRFFMIGANTYQSQISPFRM